jgi:copper chaperone
MEKSVIRVEGMSCQHCVTAVSDAVNALPGIGSVDVDLDAGLVTVQHDPAQSPLEAIKAEIEGQGFDVF